MKTLTVLTLSTLLFLSSGCQMEKDLEACRLELQQLNDTVQKSQLEVAIQVDKYKQQIADLKENSMKKIQALKVSLTEKVQQAKQLSKQATARAEEYRTTLQEKVKGFMDAQTKLEKMEVEMDALKKKLLETLTENEQLKKKVQKLQEQLQAAAAAQPPELPASPEIE